MTFNINTFKNKGLVYGGARPSLFSVDFGPLPANLNIAKSSLEKFTFLCKTAQLPESSIGAIEVPYFGRKIKVAGERVYSDWAVTVLNDEDFIVRSLFENWSNAINRKVANVRNPNLTTENYKVDLNVTQYGKDGSILRAYTLVGSFPTTVGAIGLNWESANAIEEFSVNFAYDYWIPAIEVNDRNNGVNGYASDATADGPNA